MKNTVWFRLLGLLSPSIPFCQSCSSSSSFSGSDLFFRFPMPFSLSAMAYPLRTFLQPSNSCPWGCCIVVLSHTENNPMKQALHAGSPVRTLLLLASVSQWSSIPSNSHSEMSTSLSGIALTFGHFSNLLTHVVVVLAVLRWLFLQLLQICTGSGGERGIIKGGAG